MHGISNDLQNSYNSTVPGSQIVGTLFALDGDNETGNQAHVFQETMKGKLSVQPLSVLHILYIAPILVSCPHPFRKGCGHETTPIYVSAM